jgi:hypothetical protein
MKVKILAASVLAALLSGCGGDNDSPSTNAAGNSQTEAPIEQPSAGKGDGEPGTPGGDPETPQRETLKIGILPDTQGGGENVSIHPMEAVLAKFESLGVDIVIPVGDLTDNGSTRELQQWTTIASEYRDRGMEFLPLMGNHEDSFAYMVEWIENMKDYIPKDAVHMTGAQYLDYFVVRDNVLIIVLKYYHLPVAFQWIKQVVEENRDKVEHIVIASHDGLVGAKYGETREMIVEGTKGDDRLFHQWDDIRAFFSKHDVLWVQGHEHMYQRSVIKAPLGIGASSWRASDRNYRLPQYTQIVSGNASYKGYEFRYGERELVQSVIQQKMATLSNGSLAFDANATVLSFDGPRVGMEAYFAEHTIMNNEEGAKELAKPQWQLFDKFSRTTDRCERLVFANSIPASTRPVMLLDPQYWTNNCTAKDGSQARLIAGVNNTFNRVESTTRTMGWTPGFSRAESQADLMRLAYQFLFQYHESWTPNLNGRARLRPSADEFEVEVPETTIDMKEHVTLSWLEGAEGTASDVLIVSGTQQQTGTFSSAYGAAKHIEVDAGLPGSQPDGSAKMPVQLPPSATKKWDISDAIADPYVVQFAANEGLQASDHTLARKVDGKWQPLVSAECMLDVPFGEGMLQAPQVRPAGCEGQPLVGYDKSFGNRWWAVLDSDVELALIRK